MELASIIIEMYPKSEFENEVLIGYYRSDVPYIYDVNNQVYALNKGNAVELHDIKA